MPITLNVKQPHVTRINDENGDLVYDVRIELYNVVTGEVLAEFRGRALDQTEARLKAGNRLLLFMKNYDEP